LDREMQRYRPDLGLTPDEALSRAATARPEEKKLLEKLGGPDWGPVQIYFRLSPNDLAGVRAGPELTFGEPIGPGVVGAEPFQQPLPPGVARGVLQSQRDFHIRKTEKGILYGRAKTLPDDLPPAAFPGARARVTLRIDRSEVGQLSL